jgi:ribonuclease P protein component
MDNTFDKSLVLSRQTAIDDLFHEGKRVRNSVFTIIHQKIPFIEVPFQVLVSVPKRKIKKAVNRNYLKRCIREVIRKRKTLLIQTNNSTESTVLYAVVYNSTEKLDFSDIEKHLTHLLNKIQDSK